MTIQARVERPAASVELARVVLPVPTDDTFQVGRFYRLDLALRPRSFDVSMNYPQHWSSRRFEPAGLLTLVPPGECIRFRSDVGSSDSLIFHLAEIYVLELLEADFEWTDHRIDASVDLANPAIRNMLLQVSQEIREPGFASAVVIDALIMQIAVQLHRYYCGVEQNGSTATLASWRLRKIEERVRECDAMPSLTELASLCKLSVRQLSRSFRAAKGISLGSYVSDLRIQRARCLLSSGQSVKAVAYNMGFSSPSSFSYAFRKATGVPPSTCRD